MKTIALSLIAGAVLTAVTPALAYAPAVQTEPTPQATDVSFTGWVSFNSGEFQLYARKTQGSCFSGALPRGLQEAAQATLNGSKVRVTGVTRVWDKTRSGQRYGGAVIRNDCGQDFVIEATRMSPI